MRKNWFKGFKGNHYAITIEIPDEQVLLSDEGLWHRVLNDGYLNPATNEEDYDKNDEWFDNLPSTEQQREKEASWQEIFNTKKIKNDWCHQGCFWELRKDQVVTVRKL